MSGTQLLADTAVGAGGAIAGLLGLVVMFGIFVLVIAGMWKMFDKAGKPGWAAIIPIYNAVVLLEIIGRPVWWIILFIVPLVNFVIAVIVYMDLSASFGKSGGFTLGLVLLPFVFVPILGFGDAQYRGPAAA